MKLPMITDLDEWDYLDSLRPYAPIGVHQSDDQGYYARVLQRKYQECGALIAATTFQILQPGFSSDPVQLSEQQIARQRLFASSVSPLTKDRWLKLLGRNALLPSRS
jgi:hypothetical protein